MEATKSNSQALFYIDHMTEEIVFNDTLMENIRFAGKAFIGENVAFRLASVIPRIEEAKNILITTYNDDNFVNTFFPSLKRSLNGTGRTVLLFNRIMEPTIALIKELAAVIRNHKVDAVIALGGGTVIDVSKAAAGLALQDGAIEDYLVEKKPFDKSRNVLVVAVPTIVSSGSEGNDCAVYITDNNKKTSIRGLNIPYVAIDPLFLASVPVRQATITGLDGLCQTIEAFVNPNSGSHNDIISMEAIRLFNKNLPPYLEGNKNENVLWELSIAGYLHAVSNYNVTYDRGGLGLAHSLVHLCNKYNIVHGNMVAILLPSTLRFLLHKAPSSIQKLINLGEVFKIAAVTAEPETAPEKVIDYIDNFIKFFLRRVNLPITLQEAEVSLHGYLDIIESEKAKIVNGPLNVEVYDEHLLMILKSKHDFSEVSTVKEKILLDIAKMNLWSGASHDMAQEIRSIEKLLSDVLNNYHFVQPGNVNKMWNTNDKGSFYELVDAYIKKNYKNAVRKVEGRDRILGIC